MKRPGVNANLVSQLARLAGFDFAAERCEILAPQLDWMLEEAHKIDRLERAGVEPANTFSPALWTPPQHRWEDA